MSHLWLIRGYPEVGSELLFIIYNGILKIAYWKAVSNWDGTFSHSWLHPVKSNIVDFTVKLSRMNTGLNTKHHNRKMVYLQWDHDPVILI